MFIFIDLKVNECYIDIPLFKIAMRRKTFLKNLLTRMRGNDKIQKSLSQDGVTTKKLLKKLLTQASVSVKM